MWLHVSYIIYIGRRSTAQQCYNKNVYISRDIVEVKFAIYLYSTIRVGWLNRHHTQRRRVCANEMDGIWREGSSSNEGVTESATGKELAQPTTTSPYQFVGFVCIVCASFRNHLTNMWSFAISSCIIIIIIITIIVMVCFFFHLIQYIKHTETHRLRHKIM